MEPKAGRYMMLRFFRLLLTEKDNETYEITRFLMMVGFFSFILFTWIDLSQSRPFDPYGYSVGLTGILFGGAGGIAVKEKKERQGKEDGKDQDL